MCKVFLKIAILLSFAFYFAAPTQAQNCDKLSKRAMKGILGGYFYDASRLSKFPTDQRPLHAEYEITLFSASLYNLVWYVDDIPSGAVIKLYEKGKSKKDRKLLFTSENARLKENKTYNFEIRNGKRKKLVIVYEVSGNSSPGCIRFIMGFRGAEEVVRHNTNRVVIED